jgi:hypothetical protein
LKRLALGVATAVVAACGPSSCASKPKAVVLDLAQRVGVAERWSQGEMVLFGSPAAEPHLVSGFFREAEVNPASPFVWAGQDAELSFTWAQPAPRQALLDVAPFRGVKSQSAEVSLNGTKIATLTLNDTRCRCRCPRRRPGTTGSRSTSPRPRRPAPSTPRTPTRGRWPRPSTA